MTKDMWTEDYCWPCCRYKLIVGDLDIGWLHCNMSLEKPSPAQSTPGALNETFMLFDLLNDPYERTDLSTSTDPVHQVLLSTLCHTGG